MMKDAGHPHGVSESAGSGYRVYLLPVQDPQYVP